MAIRRNNSKSGFNWKLPFGILVLGAVGYFFTGGSDSSTDTKATPAKTKASTSSTTDAFLPSDYSATFPVLKIDAKDAFQPLIHKPLISVDPDHGLPNTITGGGSWSYDGMVAVNGNVQGLMDETKTGESDYISVGQHWKHGRVRKISDSEIVFSGDDGSTATLKMGDSSAVAQKSAPEGPNLNAPMAIQPPALPGDLEITPLPAADQGGNNNNFGNRRRGRGGRRNGFMGIGQ